MLHVTPETRTRLEAWKGAIAERDDAIRQAHKEGGSLREIAGIVGMTHTHVRRIINKETTK